MSDKACEACREDAESLSGEAIQQGLVKTPGWDLKPRGDIPVISRRYEFDDFASALAFTNKVGALAEEKGHHPELITEWGAVTVSWWSHKIRGLHELDFVMARQTDTLADA